MQGQLRRCDIISLPLVDHQKSRHVTLMKNANPNTITDIGLSEK